MDGPFPRPLTGDQIAFRRLARERKQFVIVLVCPDDRCEERAVPLDDVNRVSSEMLRANDGCTVRILLPCLIA